MDGPQLIADGLGRVNQLLHRVLPTLPHERLNRIPATGSNSISWLAWRLTRIHDDHLSSLIGEPQLWETHGWRERFGFPPGDNSTGGGHSPQQAAAFTVDSPETLLAYNDPVYQRTQTYLANLHPSDLDRQLNEPQYNPLPTLGVRLVSVLNDNTQHAGQIAYLRGYFEGFGWRP